MASKYQTSASHPDTVVSTNATTRSANAAKAKASTPTVTHAFTGNLPNIRFDPKASTLAAITGVSANAPDYLKNAAIVTPKADAAYNARKAEQEAAAWQQQYDNIYGNPDTPDGGDVYGGGGGATRASSGGSSGGGGASTASLIGNLVTDPTAEVRQRYAGILADLANNNQYVLDKLKGNYDTSVNTINADYDTSISRQNADAEDALRQAYINYMMSRKNMDSALARQGYTGGLSESNQARMFNNYGNIRNDIRKTLNNAIENYNLKRNAALGEALNQYNAQLADQASDYFNKKQNYETALSNALANLMR